jgi:hypothetical protein
MEYTTPLSSTPKLLDSLPRAVPRETPTSTSCDNKPFRHIFKGRQKRSGHPGNRGAFPTSQPYLRINRFQGRRLLKRNLALSRCSVRQVIGWFAAGRNTELDAPAVPQAGLKACAASRRHPLILDGSRLATAPEGAKTDGLCLHVLSSFQRTGVALPLQAVRREPRSLSADRR